jgi:hypothetical protein
MFVCRNWLSLRMRVCPWQSFQRESSLLEEGMWFTPEKISVIKFFYEVFYFKNKFYYLDLVLVGQG